MSTLANPTQARPEQRHVLPVAASPDEIALLRRGPRIVKRAFDLALGLLLALVALPLGLLIALAIAIESPGPVLFGHTRVGKDRRRFRLWKFRSMVLDSDDFLRRHLEENPHHGAEWRRNRKLQDDPRVTRVGRFLRRTSLDELPQLWNVLRGEMSLVGPRPIVEDEIMAYGPAFSLYRHVRPGLTGLWQVSGRNNTSYGRRVELDRDYIENWSFGRDVRIVLKTIPAVISGEGAY